MKYIKSIIILTIIIVLTAGIARMFWGGKKEIANGGMIFLNNAGSHTPNPSHRNERDKPRNERDKQEGNYVVIDGKEVELKLDFKAGEEPYFVLALPAGEDEFARIDDEFSRITKIAGADYTGNMDNQKITNEIGDFGGLRLTQEPGLSSKKNYSIFKKIVNRLSYKTVEMRGIEPRRPWMISQVLDQPIPTAIALYHNLISKGKFLNTVFAAEVKPPLPPPSSDGTGAFGKGGNMDSVNVKLINPAGEEVEVGADTRLIASDGNDGKDLLEIRIPPDAAAFKPGVWKMSVEIETKKNILRAEQDFSWGVLAINRNKDVYVVRGLYAENTPLTPLKRGTADETRKGETAYLQMAVLNEMGETLCDADLELKITSPSGKETVLFTGSASDSMADESGVVPSNKTPLPPFGKGGSENSLLEKGVIYRSGKCGRNNVTDMPDYFAYYDVTEVGTYKMELTAENPPSPPLKRGETKESPALGKGGINGNSLGRGGIKTRTITDSFEAKEYVPFVIERTGPTRIYPKANYEMKILVNANEDFTGDITENIPDGFSLIGQGLLRITNKNQKTANSTAVYGLLTDLPVCVSDKLNLSIADKNSLSSPHEDVEVGGVEPPKRSLSDTQGEPATPTSKLLYHKGIIFQNVSLKAGDSFEIQYTFDAPDITPELFLVGPLEFFPLSQRGIQGDFSEDGAGDEGLTNGASSVLGIKPPQPPFGKGGRKAPPSQEGNYVEARIWQIASDSIYKTYIRNDATRTYIQAQDNTGLVGQWSLGSADYANPIVYGKGTSDQLTAVSSPALTTGFDGRANQALLFDGSADYLTQKVHDTKQGTVTASMVATNAFINDSTQDFTPYVGVAGASKPYMLVATDSTGLKAWGYIGEQGTGETLGDELITGWINHPTSPLETLTTSGRQIISAIETGTDGKCSKQLVVTTGKLYKCVMTGYVLNSGIAPYLNFSSSQDLGLGINADYVSKPPSSSFYITKIVGAYLGYRIDGGASNFSVSDTSFKQVLTPTTSGVKIYSTKTGTTQSWANAETGFNANSVSSYEIRKTDFQITGALTVGAWVKASQPSALMGIVSKYNYGYNIRSFSMGSYNGGSSNKLNVYLSSAGTGVTKQYASSNVAFDDTWHFVGFSYDGNNTLKLYIDGVEDTNPTKISDGDMTTLYNTNQSLCLGAIWNSTTPILFSGSIDEPFIYDRASSATEVLNLYNSQKKRFAQ